MSGWPAVRTRPARPSEVGSWPIAAGCLLVLVAVPAAAGLLVAQDALAAPSGPLAAQGAAGGFLALLAASPLMSWAFLLAAAPLAVLALKRGLAGWLVALAAGAAAGAGGWMLMWSGLDHVRMGLADLGIMALVGAVLGGAFWLGLRLAAPRLVAPRAATGGPATR